MGVVSSRYGGTYYDNLHNISSHINNTLDYPDHFSLRGYFIEIKPLKKNDSVNKNKTLNSKYAIL